MGEPLVLDEGKGGEDVEVGRGVGGAGGGGAVFRVGAVVVLRPHAVDDEAGVRGALGAGGVGEAVLGGPGEGEEIEIEGCGYGRCLGGAGGRGGFRGGGGRLFRSSVAANENGEGEEEEGGSHDAGSVRHGGELRETNQGQVRWIDLAAGVKERKATTEADSFRLMTTKSKLPIQLPALLQGRDILWAT